MRPVELGKAHEHEPHARGTEAFFLGQTGAAELRARGDAEAIAEAVQRPTMKFVATKTADQLDLQALHRGADEVIE
jgi:transposase